MEQIGTNITRIGKRSGRKDASGQEAVMNLKGLKAVLDELVKLKRAENEAREARSDAFKAAAEKHGVNAATINRLVNAVIRDKVDEEKRNTEQLALAFEECL